MFTTNTDNITLTKALSHFVVYDDQQGKTQWKLNDDASHDLAKLVMEMHDEEMPNDWRFDMIHSILTELKANQSSPINTFDMADSLTDVYNHDLKTWVSTHSRDSYIDNGIEEGLIDPTNKTFCQLIMAGQFRCIEQMIDLAVEFFGLERA